MRADILIQRLQLEMAEAERTHLVVKREDARLLLERISHLEQMAAALLRSQHDATGLQLPYKPRPDRE